MDYFGSSDENKKIFDTMPNLKCVSTVSAGYDHLGMVTYGWNKNSSLIFTPYTTTSSEVFVQTLHKNTYE